MMEDPRSWSATSVPVGGRIIRESQNTWSSRDSSLSRFQRAGSSRREGSSRRRRKRRKPLGEKLADWFRAFLAFLFSNVGIVCLVVGYTIAGAFIFESIEGMYDREIGNIHNVPISRNTTAIQLWKLTAEENIFSEKIWKSKVDKILKQYQQIVAEAVRNGWDGKDRSEDRKWSFAEAFLYSLTVITTIGYGNTCPRTMWGKVITIGYAMAGMPLFLLYLSNIGDILAKSFKWTYARCCLCRCRKRPRMSRNRATGPRTSSQPYQKNTWQMVRMQSSNRVDTVSLDNEIDSVSKTTGSDNCDDDDNNDDDSDDDDDEDDDDDDDDETNDPQQITVPLTLCLGIMVGYICVGGFLFSKWEHWDFLDGSYFCFISLSTIGFGDIVPGDTINSETIQLSFILCSMYLMLGMALIAMCFNLMQEEVIAKIRSFTRSVKHVLRCDR